MLKKLLIIVLLVAASAIYLNRAYAHIYKTIDRAGLKSPDKTGTYVLGGDSVAKLTYVALGDSLTAGVGASSYEKSFPYLLSQKLATGQTQVTLKDLAVPGYKTQDLLDSWLGGTITIQPNVVTLLVGVNDIHSNVSTATFKKNYQTILDELTKATAAKVYVIGLPAVGSNQTLWFPYNYYFRWRTHAFNNIIKQLAEQYGLTYVDLDTPTATALKHSGTYYAIDSFHPADQGYENWAQIIYDGFNK